MKRMLVLFFFFLSVSVFAQAPYIDYETVGNGPDWGWTVFSQGTNGMYDVGVLMHLIALQCSL